MLAALTSHGGDHGPGREIRDLTVMSPTAATARLTRVGRARGTLRFGELSAFLAQQLAKAPIVRLLGIGSDTVGANVADHLEDDRCPAWR